MIDARRSGSLVAVEAAGQLGAVLILRERRGRVLAAGERIGQPVGRDELPPVDDAAVPDHAAESRPVTQRDADPTVVDGEIVFVFRGASSAER
jgi:hypothetical protein